ncbi:MAG: DNA-binding NarL/FixJ family response regulator, partial [Alphaproteobacteria bacterium]
MVDILSNPEHEGKTQKEIAVLMNITAKTVQNYLTAH